MKKLQSYISMFLLALLLFPIGEKLKHDFEHFNEAHCGISDMHFCQAEHRCSVCDYVFSSSAIPPEIQEHLILFSKPKDQFQSKTVFKAKSSPRFNIFLRGPPIKA